MPVTSDVNNIQLGACIVTFGSDTLGLTKGGVEVTLATTTYKITVDQFGGSEVNEYITGRTASVKVPLAETSLDRFAIAFPGAVIITDKTTATKKKLNGVTGVGTSLRSLAGALNLHPKNVVATDKSQDFTLPIASPKGDMSFSYKHDEERVYNVEFEGYPDLTTNVLFVIGDTSATAV
jgi:hypothetical protein